MVGRVGEKMGVCLIKARDEPNLQVHERERTDLRPMIPIDSSQDTDRCGFLELVCFVDDRLNSSADRFLQSAPIC